MIPEKPAWSRLILWRPRAGFSLPEGWAERELIPLGEIRPLLQALSPVRDLSDLWRWVAAPMPLIEVAAALAPWLPAERELSIDEPGGRELTGSLTVDGQRLRAAAVLAVSAGQVERIELQEEAATWFRLTPPEAQSAVRTVARSLRHACGCIAVAL